jgi:hypothetical protein
MLPLGLVVVAVVVEHDWYMRRAHLMVVPVVVGSVSMVRNRMVPLV